MIGKNFTIGVFQMNNERNKLETTPPRYAQFRRFPNQKKNI